MEQQRTRSANLNNLKIVKMAFAACYLTEMMTLIRDEWEKKRNSSNQPQRFGIKNVSLGVR